MRCVQSSLGSSSAWHTHPFDELTLVTDGATLNGFAAGTRAVTANTLLHYRAGERHGHWNDARQSPRFWVIHFEPGEELGTMLPPFTEPLPERRLWRLTDDEATAFRFHFLKLVTEHAARRRFSPLAAAAWLRLLLVNVARWAERQPTGGFAPTVTDPRLLQLWHAVNECAAQPAELARRLRAIPGYDSLRHRFKDEFGCPPVQMALRLRMEQAKNLLLETSLSVKEIAARSGYRRQHEFTRAFRRIAGRSPTRWRLEPQLPAK